MLSHYQLVGIFHDVFGHPLRTEPYLDCFDKDPNIVPFRMSLIREELDEYKQAQKENNIIEQADALCDAVYVIHGAGHCLGIKLDNQDIQNIPNIMIYNFEEEIKNFELCYQNEIFLGMAISLNKLLNMVHSLAKQNGFHKFDEMFREVHRSNMSKVCTNMEDVNMSIAFYKKENRYKNPSYKIKNDYYVIYDAETSKILKNHKWETPNLKQFFL